jgi:hypothetical protein
MYRILLSAIKKLFVEYDSIKKVNVDSVSGSTHKDDSPSLACLSLGILFGRISQWLQIRMPSRGDPVN